ncbi:hypothetical protein [Amycolatopsis rifamycinica]|uniref:hypothetical protein n=1 Tax=Amycolatopsis rifamycinica TaxID=287986 RepID=UPI000ABA33C2
MTGLGHRFTADSVGRALDLVGERWSLLILRETFFGLRRYASSRATCPSRARRCPRG